MSRDFKFFLDDILEACNKILLYTEKMSFELKETVAWYLKKSSRK